ncbi:hypothetical protein R5R35_010377 [Gryllus longicercus]|uniref:Protein with SprT-like domain at the N terminus n=1 Tax=Gryllus longicercus TaxID=2509291 RepID=A0AAN9VDM0_9ORTH
MDSDLALALKLQEEFDEEFSRSQKKSFLDLNDEPTTKVSLIDPSLEYSDPTPDIHRMFVNFDKRFFWNKLGSVEVKWSPRMTTCAGLCRYRSRNGETSISLSLPLLKLRPRKDLVETLLHEMIHAFLFVTKNNKDRDGHGPEFQSHMNRINKSAGTNITIYHSFHAEVNLYKTHWWRCNGPCQNQKPFYGFVKRASNRAPGRYDFWFADHQRNCGGVFIKVKEPENYKSKKKLPESGKQGSSPSEVRKIEDFFIKGNTKPIANGITSQGTDQSKFSNSTLKKKKGGTFTSMKSGSFTVTKPVPKAKGTIPTSTKPSTSAATNTGAPTTPKLNAPTTSKVNASSKGIMTFSNLTEKEDPKESQGSSVSNHNIVPFSGKGYTLGKASVPVSDKPWLKRFNAVVSSQSAARSSSSLKQSSSFTTSTSGSKKIKINDWTGKSKGNDDMCTVACPVCSDSVKASEVNDHLDLCLSNISLEGDMNDDDNNDDRCIACNQTLGRKCNVPTLCSICEQGACSNDFDNPNSKSDDCSINCPMCEKKMSNGDLERHLELCIKAEVEDNQTRICDDDDDDVIVLD